ncbi:hypothetical protein [Parachitinimonas caeni]|uniref:Zinc ribbon domain-containing protein n=1 Tax=Parachitinimonas caeni TaxID=3031301 RepID=A0ABT7DTJ7_9NEIS|nr:hypothetical protein [Parachitinimonas caeni]MDK2123388.1 hypothetical protein [Parachitinimonas caeni]
MERPTCPKCGYSRQPSDTAPATECPRCGIVFAKYAEHLANRAAGKPAARLSASEEIEDEAGWVAKLQTRLFALPNQVDTTILAIEALAFGVFLLWGLNFIFSNWRDNHIGASFMHQVNLPFHEFGHVLFRPFGEWMTFLGGSLFQCLLPLILAGVFVWRESKPFSASFCVWWMGQSVMDVAPYIGDATAMDMPLIGEYTEEIADNRALRHDWHNILEPLGLLHWDQRLATLAHLLGAGIMLTSWAWGGWYLWRCWQQSRQN